MTLRDQGKVIVEVGLNETLPKGRHPHLPCTPAEIAADAVACVAAGAAVVHWHARNPDGSQAWTGHGQYREALEIVGRSCNPVVYPTYFADLSHVWAIDDDPPPGCRFEMAPFDVFQEVRNPMWNARADALRAIDLDRPEGAEAGVPPNLAEMQRRGLVPSIAAFELGELRWAAHAARLGLFDGTPQVKLFLCGQYLKGPAPTIEGLRAFLAQWPADIPAEITVVAMTMHEPSICEEILRESIALGAHVRVGIGDNPDAWPGATNVELVSRAVEEIRKAGLEPASPDDVRRAFGR